MSTREEIPDSVPSGSTADIITPTGLDNFLPGATDAGYPVGYITPKEEIHSELAGVESTVDGILDGMAADTIATANPLMEDVEQLQGTMVGSATNLMEDIGQTQAKLATKLDQSAASTLYDIYSRFEDLGYPAPTPDQIAYASASNDYLNSLSGILDTIAAQQTDTTVGNEPTKCLGTDITGSPLPSNYPTDYHVLTDCLPHNEYGNPITPDGTILVDQNGHCPPGYKPCAHTGWFGPVDCCIPDIGFGSGQTAPTSPTIQQVCDTTDGFSVATNFATAAKGSTDAGGLWVEMFVNLDGTEPQGDYTNYKITYFSPTLNKLTNSIAYAPSGWLIGYANGMAIAYESDYPGILPFKCAQENIGTGSGPGIEPTPGQTEASCPIPEKFKNCLPDSQTPVLTANNDGTCLGFEEVLKAITASEYDILNVIAAGIGEASDTGIAATVIKAITGGNQPIVASLINSFGRWFKKIAKDAATSAPCDKARLVPIAMYSAIWKFVGMWTGAVPKALTETLQQAENIVCQTVMPAQQSVDAAYLAGEIDRDIWECWTKLNGNVIQAAEKGIDVLRSRPTPLQLSQLYRRGYLAEAEWRKRMREGGVMREIDRDAILQLTQDWPSLSDLTPMLVRDVFDEVNIDWTEADKLFEDKYTEQTRKYFDAIGITKEVAKYYWRGHFHLPSFTMATEMIHRFRALNPNDPLHMDTDKLRKLLIQDDWSPEWIDRMIAVSFRTLTRVDTRRAYELRTLDDDQLKEQLRYLGYDDRAVDLMFSYWKRNRQLRDIKASGFPTIRGAVNAYANCEISRDQFRFVIGRIAENEDQKDYSEEAADMARLIESNKRTISGVQWQYKRGLITEIEATNQLSSQGIDPSCIPALVQKFKAGVQKQPKQLSASKLCQMREYGIISAEEMVVALIRTGWTALDAQRITQECSSRLTDKAMRKANAEANRIAREMRREEKERLKAIRLAECGPVPCPANRKTTEANGQAGP